jgi:PAS domain S-box-containing protein
LAGAGGLATLLVAILTGTGQVLGRPEVFGAFAGAMALSHAFPLVLLHREETEGLQLDEAFLVAMGLLLPPAAVVVAFALGLVAGHAVRRRGLLKTVFNVGESLTAAGLAVLTMRAVGPVSGPIGGGDIGAVVAGAGVFLLVQSVAVSFVIALAEGRRFGAVFVDGLRVRLVVWAGTVSAGVLAGMVGSNDVWALAFAALPVATLQLAFTGHLRARLHRGQMAGLFDAARSAHASMGVQDVERAIIAAARGLLRCESARLDGSPAGEGELGARLRSSTFEERWLVVSGRLGVEPFDASDGAVLDTLAAICADALDNARLYREVHQERRTLDDVVTSSSDGIFSLDADGIVALWNPAMERITGRPAGDMLGRGSLAELLPEPVDDALVVPAGGMVPADGDLEIRAANGERRWLRCTASPMPAGGVAVVARDITQAREVERMKDDFVATVSHELRTPLTPIKGWARTILQLGSDMTDRERTEALRSILTQAERLERLITNLLEVAKIQGRAEPGPVILVDVRSLTAKLIDQFRETNPGHTVRLVTPDAHVPRVQGDPTRIEQILSNLLSNAIKYAPADEPVDVQVSKVAGAVEIAVVDRGPGIPAHEQERLFERFSRLGDHMTRTSGGTGLGLYIARELARAVGGSLAVMSTPGAGSTFVLRLKAASALSLVG